MVADEKDNWNKPDAQRSAAEQMNQSSSERERSDFQRHVTTRADAQRGRRSDGGSLVGDRFRAQLDAISDDQRAKVMKTAEDLVKNSAMTDEQAIMQALSEQSKRPRRDEEELESPEVSLAQPHGPEGESHGGRGGRDPLRFVEDSTPAGTNAYSKNRGGPSNRRRETD